jgi:two-component system, chemotaxis family, CheB/CheR fusion protein
MGPKRISKSAGQKTVVTDAKTIDLSTPDSTVSQYFIVALGGSAGGFEAYEEFFKNLPPDTGMGFVIISHLDPEKIDLMPELIQHCTRMSVEQAKNGLPVLPDHVYIIAPNKAMTISGRVLNLSEISPRRGVRLLIDIFLRSLAEEQHEMAVAIIFSGMGSDGALGIKAIKENNGIVLVQDPAEARFDSMPKSAINTGIVDNVAPARDLPALLVDFGKIHHNN